jgi:ubiquitin carboxyl-terminal hydrolase 25
LTLLTTPELLKSRYEALFQEDPNREGIRLATPIDPLHRLQKYVRDSLNIQHNRRQFPANNKRFQEAFGLEGQDCADLLRRLGFKYAVSSMQLGRCN